MNHIGPHPLPEMYAAGLELDCQCGRCGSSMDTEDCSECWYGAEIEDDPDDMEPESCVACGGRGFFHRCLSSPEWCQANPRPGRESVERGTIEWYTHEVTS